MSSPDRSGATAAAPIEPESSASAHALAADIDRALTDGRLDVLTPEALQALIAASCRIYAAHSEAGHRFMPLPKRSEVMDTDVMVMASALLRAVNLQVFELGMWQSWTGR